MSLMKRYNQHLIDKVDNLEAAASSHHRDIQHELKLIADRATANAASFEKINRLTEQHHDAQVKLLECKSEIRQIREGVELDTLLATINFTPEEE